MATPADYLAISDAMYVKVGETPVAPVGWSLVPGSLMVVVQNGTMAAVFKNNAANEYVVGAQGTYRSSGNDAFSSAQMSANATIAAGGKPAIYDDISDLIAATKIAHPDAVVNATGHSLAGGAVQFGAVQNNVGGASFGGPGIPNYTDDGSHGNFTSYANYGDLLGVYAPVGGSHVGNFVTQGNPLDLAAETGLLLGGKDLLGFWALVLKNHALSTYAVNILGPDTPTPVPFHIQKMMDESPYGGFGAPFGNDATSQSAILPDGTLIITYKAPDGTLLGNATQNVDGNGSVSLFATSGQSWIKETGFFDTKGQLASAESQKVNGDVERTSFDTASNQSFYARTLTEDLNGALKSQADVLDSLDRLTKYYDTQNTHPYRELDVSTDSTGKVTAAQVQLENNIIAAGGSVGQIFGSALGRALAPDNQFAQLAVGTVAGLIGQKLFQTFTASLTVDASRFVASNFATVTGLDVAHAGIGAISSFLTAELGHELHLTGLAGDVFNAGAGGVTASVFTQVVDKMVNTGVSFDAAIGFIDWSLAATQAGYNVSSAVGSFLAHQFVPAETHSGQIGGQLFGAVGSALGLNAVINATITGFSSFLIPGLGSFFGTIIGTIIGDAIAGDPGYPKATHDVEILGSDLHFQNRLVGTDDNGNAAVSKQMGDQVTSIANSYLDAVHGAAIDHRGKVMIGYNAGALPDTYIAGWFPNGTEVVPHFSGPHNDNRRKLRRGRSRHASRVSVPAFRAFETTARNARINPTACIRQHCA
jgi:hypothetical protein